MSKERLKEIYEKLSGEPTPEEEEQAKHDIISALEKMIEETDDDSDKTLYNEALQITKSWDTLDKWFVEMPDLVSKIKEILSDVEAEDAQPEQEGALTAEQNNELSKEIAEAIAEATQDLPAQVDIKQIIKEITKQVTKNFLAKHEIEGTIVDEPEEKEKLETSQKTGGRLSLSKDDIMNDLLKPKGVGDKKATEKKEDDSKVVLKPKLSAPKISIPKVVKPKKKIVPKKKTEPKPQPKSEPKPAEPKKTTVKLPQPKKISIPQAHKISASDKKPIPQPKAEEKPKSKKKVIIKPASIQKPKTKPKLKIKTVQSPPQATVIDENGGEIRLQPINVDSSTPKPAAKIQPVSKKKPKIVVTPSQKPKSGKKKPKINVSAQPVSVSNAKPQQNEIKPLKPVKMSQNNSKNALFQAFNKRGKSNGKDSQTQVGGIKAVNISGGEIEGFKAQSVDAPKEQFEFVDSGDIYAKMSKDELYQELIALEGKKYAIERARKDMRAKHEKGQVPDVEYKTAIERFKYDLEHISDKINDLRRRVQTL